MTVMLTQSTYTEGYKMGYCARIAEPNQSACDEISEADVARSRWDHADDAEYGRGFLDGEKKYLEEVAQL